MAVPQSKLKVRVDMARNRLYCIIGGDITKADLEGFFTDVRFGVADLKPGFGVITDLTNCHLSHLAAIPTFRRVMHYLAGSNVGKVIRVVNTKNLIYQQAINLASRLPGYSSVYVKTMAEAEEFLDGACQREGLRYILLDKSIELRTESGSSSGTIINISVSGCAIKCPEPRPVVGQGGTVAFTLADKKSAHRDFEIEARVVRLFDDGFAVAYQNIADADKSGLQKCLVQESKLDVSSDRLMEKIFSPPAA